MASLSAEWQWIADLITAEGRVVTLKALVTTPTDPSKPWRAAGEAMVSPDITVSAVTVAYSPKQVDGSHILKTDLQAFCALHATADLGIYDRLVDTNGDGRTWQIANIEKIEPGTEILLYKLQLRR